MRCSGYCRNEQCENRIHVNFHNYLKHLNFCLYYRSVSIRAITLSLIAPTTLKP